jgi:hypothetical protein
MRAKWLKFSILPSIKVRVGGQCIAPKTRTTLILDRWHQFLKKMTPKILLFVSVLILSSCREMKTDEIYGKWTTIDVIDNTDMNLSDRIVFSKDGNYEMVLYSNGDSVVSRLNGSFEIDHINITLNINTKDMIFSHKIIELKGDCLRIETQQGQIMRMKKLK